MSEANARRSARAPLGVDLSLQRIDFHLDDLAHRLPTGGKEVCDERAVAQTPQGFIAGVNDRVHIVTQALQAKLARSQSEGWNLRLFNRHGRRPVSALAEVFSRVSRLGTEYLNQVPHRQYLLRSLGLRQE
jgi:hypothetical protein